jgi:pSer/pThr/pTyr-binding forkhead associated (FHA) protein
MVRGALPRLVLRGLSGPTLGRSYPLRDGMRIGRSRECDVFVETREISRQHARLEVSAQGVQVEDLGSTNGTFVNGKRVARAPLQLGDELALDTVRFVLLEPGANPLPAPAAKPPRRVRPWLPVLLVIALALLGLWLGWQWR